MLFQTSKAKSHIYTPRPLKLENNPHVPPSIVSIPDGENQSSGDTFEVNDGKQPNENLSKSSLKEEPSEPDSPKEVGKKRVQWMDFLGKELVEIRELNPGGYSLPIPVSRMFLLPIHFFDLPSDVCFFFF